MSLQVSDYEQTLHDRLLRAAHTSGNAYRLVYVDDSQMVIGESKPFLVALVSTTPGLTDILEIDTYSVRDKITDELTFDELIKLSKKPNVLVEGKPPLTYKDYRRVDVSHVNKLHSLMDYPASLTEIENIPVLQGMCTLPGGFIVTTGFNKPLSPGAFNQELGLSNLRKDLELKADEKMWELEGYRLYRNLHTIDALCTQYNKVSSAFVRMIANGADIFRSRLGDYVYVSNLDAKFRDVVATSDNNLHPHTAVVPYDLFLQVRALVNTYIENP